MPGLYLHIPFCKQACHYCNFHFSTSLRHRGPMVEALLREMTLQRHYLGGVAPGSVYLGGGTPSLLDTAELVRMFEYIQALTPWAKGAEITLEANPDDLTPEKLREWREHTPINRLSIGVQSFSDADLTWMNRAHHAGHARTCIEAALSAGFDNLTVDLIYGAPTTSDAQWQENVRIVFGYGVAHLSCYCLTVEEGTALGHFVASGKSAPVDEDKSARQFEWLQESAAAHGYEHYEISNFARPGAYARHNTNYWMGEPYLGIGPSAHSFDGAARQWNVANNARYLAAIEADTIPCEQETLTLTQRYNEYTMTALRTMWGCNTALIEQRFGADYAAHFRAAVQPFLAAGTVEQADGVFTLTRSGKFLADGIAAAVFA